jgi:hypothetical protein
VKQESINDRLKSAVLEIIGIGYRSAHEKPSLESVGTGSPERASNSYQRRTSSIQVSLRSHKFTSFTRAIKDQIARYLRARQCHSGQMAIVGKAISVSGMQYHFISVRCLKFSFGQLIIWLV